MEKHITLPLTEELARTLKAGDTVYLTGIIMRSRFKRCLIINNFP